MTNGEKEKAIEYFKWWKSFNEHTQKAIPKDTIAYMAYQTEIGFYDMAIKALEQEPKTGHWILRPHIYGVAFCSECGFELRIDNTNYCPNCGAKMREMPKRKALKPIEGNNDSYNCENWIP